AAETVKAATKAAGTERAGTVKAAIAMADTGTVVATATQDPMKAAPVDEGPVVADRDVAARVGGVDPEVAAADPVGAARARPGGSGEANCAGSFLLLAPHRP
ncbi:MAG: hypothetical protein ACI9HE_000432, partial [Planctomycetota bacterium]